MIMTGLVRCSYKLVIITNYPFVVNCKCLACFAGITIIVATVMQVLITCSIANLYYVFIYFMVSINQCILSSAVQRNLHSAWLYCCRYIYYVFDLRVYYQTVDAGGPILPCCLCRRTYIIRLLLPEDLYSNMFFMDPFSIIFWFCVWNYSHQFIW